MSTSPSDTAVSDITFSVFDWFDTILPLFTSLSFFTTDVVLLLSATLAALIPIGFFVENITIPKSIIEQLVVIINFLYLKYISFLTSCKI